MKKLTVLICLALCLITALSADAQESVRVSCDRFTLNVPSQNARCYQIKENIPVSDGSSASEIANAQVACIAIVFSDYESISSSISPEVIFYRVDDLGQTSFDLMDLSMDLGDILSNIDQGFFDPASMETGIPFLPYQENEQQVNALSEKLEFSNGSGLRTITTFQDSISTSSGMSNLYYSFQGLSADGVYYISAVFPLQAPELNGKMVSDINWDEVTGSSFRPSLEELDYYIRSIVIE